LCCRQWLLRRFPADRTGRFAVVLVKPQFEVGRELVGKGGIVRDETAQLEAVEKIRKVCC